MNHNTQAQNAKGYSVWIVKTDEGIEREFIEVQDIPVIEQLIKDTAKVELRYQEDDAILAQTLSALRVPKDKRHTNMYLLCQTLLQAKILLDSEEYIAIESVDGYIANTMLVTNITKKSYLEDFANLLDGFHKWENGKVVLDEEKKAEYLSTLQGG